MQRQGEEKLGSFFPPAARMLAFFGEVARLGEAALRGDDFLAGLVDRFLAGDFDRRLRRGDFGSSRGAGNSAARLLTM